MLAPPPTIPHQRARGRAELTLRSAPEGARIASLYNAAPLRLLFPDSDPDDPATGAFVNVAGGLAGGDSLEVALTLGRGARFTATTPAAEKIYRSLGPETKVASSLTVGADATLEWLPQETILFDGARLSRRLDADLSPGARLLAAELLVLGRAARGERLTHGALSDRWRIRREGRTLWADTLRLPDPPTDATGRFALGDAGAIGTLVLAAADAAVHLDAARELGAATLPAPGLLLLRWLGEATACRAAIGAAVVALRARALGHPARLPRLWRT